MKLCSRGRVWQSQSPAVTGVLNVTPDSFYKGSRVATTEDVLRLADLFLREGADMLEVGGESTGPMSSDVSAEEEMQRVVPAVGALRQSFPDAWIVVDTRRASVAKAALEAGADILNDVTAGRSDDAYFSVAAEACCPLILMYAKDDSPRTTVKDMRYDDVVSDVRAFLLARIESAVATGVRRDAIIVDPGLGHFVSSDPAYSYELLSRVDELAELAPVLVSPSRKSCLAGPENAPVSERLPATLAASALAVCRGASWVRTHDVAATKKTMHALTPLLHVLATQRCSPR